MTMNIVRRARTLCSCADVTEHSMEEKACSTTAFVQAQSIPTVTTSIVKWGNSRGVRLPKHLLDSVQLEDNDEVQIITKNDNIIITKIDKKKAHKTLKERLAGYKKKYTFEEWDTGKPLGKEIW